MNIENRELSQKLVDTIEFLKQSISKISVYDLNYYSMTELYYNIAKKINELIETYHEFGVSISEEVVKQNECLQYLLNDGLIKEVVNKINQMVADGTMDTIINHNIFNDLNSKINKFLNQALISVKEFGAKGDGVTDDTKALKDCLTFCTDNAKTMYFPNGTYIINETLKLTDDITSSEANKPVYIKGESSHGVFIETTDTNLKILMDFSRSKILYMENIYTKTGQIKIVQYGDDFRSFSRLRDVNVKECGSLRRDKGWASWNMFINTPAPSNYQAQEVDSNYTRYPLEIVSNSGYNPIMINNFANTNDDGTEGQPSDNSSIGILDEVKNASGAILVDGGKRSFIQFQNRTAGITSAVRNNVVYEVDGSGHIAIGCSTQTSDTNAPSAHAIKVRDNYPTVALYDSNKANVKSTFGSGDNKTYIRSYKADNTYSALEFDKTNSAVNIKDGHFSAGQVLELTDTNFVASPSVKGYSIIEINTTTNNSKWLDGIACNVLGKEITIISHVTGYVLKQGTSSTSFRNKTGANITLDKDVAYRYIRATNGWYQI